MPTLLNTGEQLEAPTLSPDVMQGILSTGETGSIVHYSDEEDSFFHSGLWAHKETKDITGSSQESLNLSKEFIELENKFKAQFEHKKHLFKISLSQAKSNFSKSVSAILKTRPDIMTFELTEECSVYYTIKNSDYTFFIQHFLMEPEGETDEALLAVYQKENKLPSHAGSLNDVIQELNCTMQPFCSSNFVLQLA